MSEFKCDSCHKVVSEKDKYKIRCNGECRRNFCMNCTGLDKATTKVICQQKYHNIRFFCSMCDSPTLKYLHDKISQLQKSQISQENVEALGTCLKRNNDLLPLIMEMYDILSNHDSKWKILCEKIDKIHSLHTGGSESLYKSIREMKQDIFNLTSVFMDSSDESIKVQVHDTSKDELLREIADLRKSVNQMVPQIAKLLSNQKSCQQTSKKSISTQTDNETTPTNVISPPSHTTSKNDDWHYVLVSRIPSTYTANQLAHYVKEKLGTTSFIRCFPMLKNKDSSYTDFKVGVRNKMHLDLLKDIMMWPPGTLVNSTSLSPPTPSNSSGTAPNSSTTGYQLSEPEVIRSPPSPSIITENSTRESNSVKIGSDKEAISACKSLVLQNTGFILDKHARKENVPPMDPLTPPMVRLSRASDVDCGRYVLARLREPSILQALRLLLAYMHDQPSSVCFEGHTKTSIMLALASEGLPRDVDSLRKLYFRFHNTYGIESSEVEADLSAFRSFVSSEKLLQLQRIRESQSKYFSCGSPSRSKNF